MPSPRIALMVLCLPTWAGCGGTGDGAQDAGGDALDWLDAGDVASDADDAAGEPASDADCQPPADVSVSLSMIPHVEDGQFTEDGTVEGIDASDPGRASFTVRFPGMTDYPPEQTYVVPITPGDELDLDVGDDVRARFERDLWGEWYQTGLHVERDGATILYYMHCMHHCSFMFMETAPLSLEVLSGICEPEEDPMGCAMIERRGYRVGCASSPDAVDVFDHESARITCEATYLVMVEDHTLVTEHLMPCSGLPDDRIEMVILRVR